MLSFSKKKVCVYMYLYMRISLHIMSDYEHCIYSHIVDVLYFYSYFLRKKISSEWLSVSQTSLIRDDEDEELKKRRYYCNKR